MHLIGEIVLTGMVKHNRWKSGLKKREWNCHGQKITYLRSKNQSSSTPVVFLHGLGANKDKWGAGIYSLTQGHECVFLDLPGEGESSFSSEDDYSPLSQVERLANFFKAIGLSQMVLVGSSIGGCIASLYAAQHPYQIEKLVVISPAGFSTTYPSLAMKAFQDSGVHPFGYRNVNELKQFWRLVFHQPPKVISFMAEAIAARGKRGYHKIDKIIQDYRTSGCYPLEKAFSSVKAETLIIWGREDQVFDYTCTQSAMSLLPSATVKIIEDAGHVPYLEKSTETVEALCDFLP